MKQKQILIGGVIVAVLGLGIYALVKSHRPASGSDDDAAPENVPSVVTVQTGALKQMTLHRYVSGYGTVEAAPATADQPAAGAQACRAQRRCRRRGERHRRATGSERRRAGGIELRRGDV